MGAATTIGWSARDCFYNILLQIVISSQLFSYAVLFTGKAVFAREGILTFHNRSGVRKTLFHPAIEKCIGRNSRRQSRTRLFIYLSEVNRWWGVFEFPRISTTWRSTWYCSSHEVSEWRWITSLSRAGRQVLDERFPYKWICQGK